MAACEFYMYIMYNGIQFKSSMYVCMCVCVHVYACARECVNCQLEVLYS